MSPTPAPISSGKEQNRTEAALKLRGAIRAIEGQGRAWGVVDLGAAGRAAPEGGLRLGALHECLPAAHFDAPAALGFLLGAASRALAVRPGMMVWIAAPRGEFGAAYGPGLAGFGVDPARLLQVRPRTAGQALWAAEEAAKAGVACVLAEIGPAACALVAARRLQLAAESSQALLLLLRPPGAQPCPAAHTRWRVAAAPSQPPLWSAGRAPGDAAFEVELLRARASLAGPRRWRWEWRHAARAFHLAAPVGDRADVSAGQPPGQARADPFGRARRAG